MVSTLNNTKRTAIAEKLADMQAIQTLLIANEQNLLSECADQKICDRLNDMIEDDQKNLEILETVIVQYGIQANPQENTRELTQKTQQLMQGNRLNLYEKFAQQELLKHSQVMAGLVVHKAAQVVGADVEAAILPLNTVNFENRAHQEQLKAVLEVVGTRELTGQDPDQGVWTRMQDAIAAMTGIVGSAISQGSERSDINIQELIFLDHRKVNILIKELEKSDQPDKAQEYFNQLCNDLSIHAEAEEQVVYPTVRSFYGETDTQELYDEQAEAKAVLDQMKSLNPTSPEFKTHLKQLKKMLGDHTRQEETTLFAAISQNLSRAEQERLASRFREAKKQLQPSHKPS